MLAAKGLRTPPKILAIFLGRFCPRKAILIDRGGSSRWRATYIAVMNRFHPVFVLGGVYLRTATGEIVGRLDEPGSPFETLDEACKHAAWLEMMLDLQQSKNCPDREIASIHPMDTSTALNSAQNSASQTQARRAEE